MSIEHTIFNMAYDLLYYGFNFKKLMEYDICKQLGEEKTKIIYIKAKEKIANEY